MIKHAISREASRYRSETEVWRRRQRNYRLTAWFSRRNLAKTNPSVPEIGPSKGTRLIAHVPHGHWETTTFLATMRTDGWVGPLVIDRTIDDRMFLA